MDEPAMRGEVLSVACWAVHRLTKAVVPSIQLRAGLGVEGDVHAAPTMRIRSRSGDRIAPNLRQVHLLDGDFIDSLRQAGFEVAPGVMGENITTRGLSLLELPTGARLHVGTHAVVEVTGLRTPCIQLERHQKGLMHALAERGPNGELVRKAGVMAIVLEGGTVRPGDRILVEAPPGPHRRLEPV